MRNTAATEVQDEGSLYDQIVDATGIEYDEAQHSDVEGYKNILVRHFGHMDASEFDALPVSVRDWVNDATEVFNSNRRAKEREPLPDIEGMPEDEPAPPPPPARRARVAFDEDEDDEAPPPATTRRGRAAPVEDDDDQDDEPEPAPPPRAGRRNGRTATPAPAPKLRAARQPAAEQPTRRTVGRDPDSGRYAKVMPHYLKDRDITVPELQQAIAKTDGESYSETTLDRTLAACVSVVGWLERNGVDLKRLSR